MSNSLPEKPSRWQRFVDAYMTASTRAEMRELYQLWLDRHHRCLHPESVEAERFAERTKKRLHELQPRYPWIVSSSEFNFFDAR